MPHTLFQPLLNPNESYNQRLITKPAQRTHVSDPVEALTFCCLDFPFLDGSLFKYSNSLFGNKVIELLSFRKAASFLFRSRLLLSRSGPRRFIAIITGPFCYATTSTNRPKSLSHRPFLVLTSPRFSSAIIHQYHLHIILHLIRLNGS